MMRIALIGCGKSKADHECQARDMYTGSLFRATLAHCEDRFDRVYILSAFHGLLPLDQVIQPYDRTMSELGGWKYKDAWGNRAASRLLCRHPRIREVAIYAGAEYAEHVARNLVLSGVYVTLPLRGLPVGRRLQWLKEAA